jgi:hypothetical protein
MTESSCCFKLSNPNPAGFFDYRELKTINYTVRFSFGWIINDLFAFLGLFGGCPFPFDPTATAFFLFPGIVFFSHVLSLYLV